MEFRDLKVQYKNNKKAIDSAIEKVLHSGNFIGGESVNQLEQELADYVRVRHCITCANGTDALQLALMVWGVGAGDAVFVPDFTFFSSAEVISCVGAAPVFVDVQYDTFNISVSKLEESIENVLKEGKLTPKVIVAVDLFGQPADFLEIKKIADKYKLFILEDAAQGFGGMIGGKRACSFGDISTTSFFPAKPLGCYGDGGAIFTDDDEWSDLLRSFKVHGKGTDKYDNVRIGMNSRLDTLQAAVLIEKLKLFSGHELEECNKVAEQYTRLLSNVVETPIVPEGMISSWAQYTLKLPNQAVRNALMSALKLKNIPSMVYYKKPLHQQEAFAGVTKYGTFEITEKLCENVLSLPMHPYLSGDDVEEVAQIVKSVCSEKNLDK